MFWLNTACNIAPEKLPFTWNGLCLQEPMALLTNWVIAITALYLFFRIKRPFSAFRRNWRKFYLFFSISTFFGGLGHLLFFYFDVFGKYPCWIFGFIAAFYASKAMISVNMLTESMKRNLMWMIYGKLFILLSAAIIFKSFFFVMADAIITYLYFCLGLGLIYLKKGYKSFSYTILAVLILMPSIYIFLMKVNPHIWFNKDDLSHVLMVLTIIFFYIGVVKFANVETGEGVKEHN